MSEQMLKSATNTSIGVRHAFHVALYLMIILSLVGFVGAIMSGFIGLLGGGLGIPEGKISFYIPEVVALIILAWLLKILTFRSVKKISQKYTIADVRGTVLKSTLFFALFALIITFFLGVVLIYVDSVGFGLDMIHFIFLLGLFYWFTRSAFKLFYPVTTSTTPSPITASSSSNSV